MNDQLLWSKRGDMDSIILIDELTSEQDKMDSLKAIWVLRDILLNVSSHSIVQNTWFCMQIQFYSKFYYENFQMNYSILITSPLIDTVGSRCHL